MPMATVREASCQDEHEAAVLLQKFARRLLAQRRLLARLHHAAGEPSIARSREKLQSLLPHGPDGQLLPLSLPLRCLSEGMRVKLIAPDQERAL